MKKFIFLLLLMVFVSVIFGQKIHVVKKGDTLWDLAGYYYNNPFIWRNIYNANIEKIKDPHWIYPGQEFLIPDVPADTTSIQESTTMEEKKTPTEEEQINFEKEVEKGENVEYSKSEISTVEMAKVKQIREDIKKIEKTKNYSIKNALEYAVAKNLAYRAGYLTLTNPKVGKIKELYKGSYQMVRNERVYVDMENTDSSYIGKEFIIFKWNNQIKDNKTNENLGKHVRIIGRFLLEGYENNIGYGKITSSYDEIQKGDFIALYDEPVINPNSSYLKVSEDITGSLIGLEEQKMKANEYSICFINLGKEKNINTGDVFTIVRKNKTGEYYAAGALQVLVPFDKYSTATVLSIKGNMDIKPYEEIKLAYRNKTEYLMKKYQELTNITGEENIVEQKEKITPQVVEPVIEEVKKEETVKEETSKQEETVKEETPVQTKQEEVNIKEEPAKEEVVKPVEQPKEETKPSEEQKKEDVIMIEEKQDTTEKKKVEGEEEVIIIEEE